MIMRKINKIIIHCSATPEGRNIKMETIKSWHVKGRGWSDIGYHFVIELDGTLKVGRHMEKMGAGVKGQNNNSIHVCYIGGIDKSSKRHPRARTTGNAEHHYWSFVGTISRRIHSRTQRIFKQGVSIF